MKLPIFIIEKNGDVTSYNSVKEAEINMEPIDVERSEYIVMDADGLRLEVKVVMEEVSLLWGILKAHIKKVHIVN